MLKLIELSARHRALVLLFAVAVAVAGWQSLARVRLDAIPDLSDPQVIVYTEWMGRSPEVVEDQVTYPLVTALLGLPQVADVRAQTMFGMSFVYVIFEDGADLDRARSRVLEQLSAARNRLPPDVAPRIGPDATGVGWVYQYALVDRSGTHDLAALRALQDYTLRYALSAVPGVAEVASVGGYEAQYQVTLDPERMRANNVTWEDVARALRGAAGEVGGRVIEMAQREYYVRGRGWPGAARDLDAARAALGEEQISFLGVSYGTRLGATYATLFPARVRRAQMPISCSVIRPDCRSNRSLPFDSPCTN